MKEEISQSLYNSRPKTLQEARNLARGQEYLLSVLDKRYKASSKPFTPGSATPFKSGYAVGRNSFSGDSSKTTSKTTPETKRLTLDEINDKKKRGLCFHCDEKFTPGHDCRKKRLYIIMDNQAEEENEEFVVIWENDNNTKEVLNEHEAGISIDAMVGSKGTHTIKVKGQIKNRAITILVDSGSTHNFISQGLAKQIKLPTRTCNPFNVNVANGEKLVCDTKSNSVSWRMAGRTFNADMNVITLGGYDLILGVKWMQTISPITFDFSAGHITINW